MTQPNHPAQTQLALYAGNDLGFWQRRRVHAHVSACERCQKSIHDLRAASTNLRELTTDIPENLNWARLSQEMTGNIRVGLAAGECIEGFEKTLRPLRPRLGWHTALILACASVIMVATLWLNLPKHELDHLVAALGQIRWERVGMTFRTPGLTHETVVLEASPSSIEVKANGRTLSLMHPRSDGATVSVNMQDSAGVRYVDADTGQVTMNKVYYAQ